MGLEKLVQRGSLYGFGAGAVTAGGIALVASLLNVVLGVVLLVLIGIAIMGLVLLLGAPGIGPGGIGLGEGYGEMSTDTEMDIPNSSVAGGASGRLGDMAAVVPTTKVEYVMYFIGFGATAVVGLAILLD